MVKHVELIAFQCLCEWFYIVVISVIVVDFCHSTLRMISLTKLYTKETVFLFMYLDRFFHIEVKLYYIWIDTLYVKSHIDCHYLYDPHGINK